MQPVQPGRMMDFPLTLTHFVERARTFFPKSELVSTLADKTQCRMTYGDFSSRVAKLAHALTTKLGVKPGDRVATLAFNHQPHVEAYFAIPCIGAVIHTLNLRLHPTELGYIAKHGEDVVVLCDEALLPLLEKFKNDVPSLRKVVVFSPDPQKKRTSPLPDGFLDYEELIAGEPDRFDWPALDENSAAMLCYTSGTTGNPKGVLYSHRSTVLHSLVTMARENMGVGGDDVVLPVVPMFHAAAWGIPFAAIACGAKMVFGGGHFDPVTLLDLMASERVTFSAGVPTIWIGILAALDAEPKRWDLSSMRTMVIGGSAAPPALIDGFATRYGLEVTHAWGMTETNPLGTLARVKPHLRSGSPEQLLAMRASQGFAVTFVEQRHTDETGRVLPWDGETMGELEVRGPWVAKSYFGDEGADRFTKDGWFKTGDVVTIDGEGYVRITDRSKDVVKSGGEWISSVQLENALMSHPAVLEAAVFAARHPKWDERPVAAVVLKPNRTCSEQDLAACLDGKFAKYWMPDKFLFVEQIPRTSTGKFLKSRLRELYGDVLVK
ncbi:MAG: 3-methylmercaptopropionyl-CoA ligase [Labilithrix sp.]|nr:3-methylmercaptopropionyl-CoA ligase [Labilithrix sp.]